MHWSTIFMADGHGKGLCDGFVARHSYAKNMAAVDALMVGGDDLVTAYCRDLEARRILNAEIANELFELPEITEKKKVKSYCLKKLKHMPAITSCYHWEFKPIRSARRSYVGVGRNRLVATNVKGYAKMLSQEGNAGIPFTPERLPDIVEESHDDDNDAGDAGDDDDNGDEYPICRGQLRGIRDG